MCYTFTRYMVNVEVPWCWTSSSTNCYSGTLLFHTNRIIHRHLVERNPIIQSCTCISIPKCDVGIETYVKLHRSCNEICKDLEDLNLLCYWQTNWKFFNNLFCSNLADNDSPINTSFSARMGNFLHGWTAGPLPAPWYISFSCKNCRKDPLLEKYELVVIGFRDPGHGGYSRS